MTALTLSTPTPPSWPSTPSSSASTPATAVASCCSPPARRVSRRRSDGRLAETLRAAGRHRGGRRGDQARHVRRGDGAAGRGRRARPGAGRRGAGRDAAPGGRAASRALAGSASVALAAADRRRRAPPAARRRRGRAARRLPLRRVQDEAAAARQDPVRKVALHVPDAADKAAKAAVKRARPWPRGRPTRDWVNTAPNDLRPPQFADAVAQAAARGRPGGRGARREGAGQGRLRRHPRASAWARPRRRGWSGSPTSRPGATAARRAGRQGHHVRHRRRVDQAGAGHVGDEVRHGRRGRGRRRR